MKVTLVGSKWFGAEVLRRLRDAEVGILSVVVPHADDRLAKTAAELGVEVVVQADPKTVAAEEIAYGSDLIVTAHSHARISAAALLKAALGGVGYHPSLLPRHRGKAAVEHTIAAGDPIAGGTVYRLADRMDAGEIVAQEWCFVRKGETARELWERALSPIGLTLLVDSVKTIAGTGKVVGKVQEEQFATVAN